MPCQSSAVTEMVAVAAPLRSHSSSRKSFAPHPYPVSGGSQPAWATAVGAPRRRRRWPYRLAGLTAVATAVAVAVLITIQVTGDDNNGVPAKVVRQAQAARQRRYGRRAGGWRGR